MPAQPQPRQAGAGPVDLPLPTGRAAGPAGGHTPAPAPLQFTLDLGRRYSLWCSDLGLACCAVEFAAAALTDRGLRPVTDPAPGGDDAVHVLVVSGTVTDAMAPAVLRLYEQLPEPRRVVSFGSCANSGGPYWDSYCVTKGVDQLIPVDVYVPGCPPRPEALVQGLLRLEGQTAPESVP